MTIIDLIAPIKTGESIPRLSLGGGQVDSAKREEPESFAFNCGEDLRKWLGIGTSELLDALGISRATYYAWKARGSTPRLETSRQLYRVHSLVSLVVDTLGERGAHGWLNLGSPSMRERLIAAADHRGELDRITEEIRNTFAPINPPPVDRSQAARAGGNEGQAPDGPLEGW
ncbi:hypothetical protein [Streptomyces sp. RKAG337]|uniref:hypothetical protein n=1 Tax=Streptomyces sp. RKAG337 TaxID=2893404 RepID=UPI0020331DAD|nr:hypothetical protein [Streptomyces sp. RKAG337]MCM2427546.1 hypothetical protein [Streptomyces sp. RKAG337]